MPEAWIIDAVRTPRAIGKVDKGAYANVHPQELFATLLSALERRNALKTGDVDDVIAGCSIQQGKQGGCLARMAALLAGWPYDTPGLTIDRFCGSGLSAVGLGAMGILSGMQRVVVAGGAESMSYISTLSPRPLPDGGNPRLRAKSPLPRPGVAADVIAALEGFTREDTDGLALESQKRAQTAIENGYFTRSTVPVEDEAGRPLLDREEYPRPDTTLQKLAQLPPVYAALYDTPLDEAGTTLRHLVEQRHPGIEVKHVHHAGNSSGVVDGAGAVLLASSDYARAQGLKPRARIRAVATAGDDPLMMLNAPVPATRKALAIAGMTTKDVDLFEVNEAFAVVPLKFMRDLGVDSARVNVNGGAIALGHPIGGTGAILLGTLLDELERRDLGVGLVTLCANGAMAPAMVIERI
ncbi:MAG: acetyl-CoA C-acyltransferase [Rhodospirillaceae bacterium]|nr:MAG: acetyl-CoA C-acyltransferase [Rhodospirillaceae bacterium]